MSIVIPEILSSDVLEDPRKQGEIKVFNCFKTNLGNDWTVFYNVSWLGKVFQSGDVRDGETDFIIANPKYGIIIAEVKGGQQIEYEGISDRWYSTNKKGLRIQIKNPYHQSRDNKYSLRNAIISWKGWENGVGNINMCHIVIFPDVTTVKGRLPLYAKHEITVVEDDFYDISNKLIQSIHFSCNNYTGDSSRTQRLINDIKNNIAPSHTIIDRKLANAISDDNNKIITLTQKQYSLLRTLQQVRRASISGCAGSGKTLLAVQKARMMVQAGHRTLLCCFNKLLGDYFETVSAEYDGMVGGNIHAVLYNHLVGPAQLSRSVIDKCIHDDDAMLETILENPPEAYDAVIIDELQDFSANLVDTVMLMTGHDSLIYCFWDNNQKVLHNDFSIPKDMQQFSLDTNFRNTKNIFDEVRNYYLNSDPIYCDGPTGLDIRWCQSYDPVNKKDLHKKLAQEITNLVQVEGIPSRDIVILTYKSAAQSSLVDFSVPGLDITAFDYDKSASSIRIETVRRFKGLESSVVIVTELDDYQALRDNELWDSMCYVAFSRARNFLVILPPTNCEDKLFHK